MFKTGFAVIQAKGGGCQAAWLPSLCALILRGYTLGVGVRQSCCLLGAVGSRRMSGKGGLYDWSSVPSSAPHSAPLTCHMLDGYRWLTPEAAESRLKHPSPRRQQLAALMLQQRAGSGAAEPASTGQQQQAAGPVD